MTSSSRHARQGFIFALPALLVLAIILAYPIVWLLWTSLLNETIPNDPNARFVGLSNYFWLAGSEQFRAAIWNTVFFTIATIIFELMLALPIALALNRTSRTARILTTLICLPLMVAPVVAGLQWRFLFADGYGVVAHVLQLAGIDNPMSLSTVSGAWASIIAASVWLALPFSVLVLLAGLADVDQSQIESSKIDGANAVQTFWFVVLPALRPALLVLLVVRITDAMRVFDIVYVLTGGGPGDATDVASTFIYRETFTRLEFSHAAAGSVVLVIIMTATSLALLKLLVGRR